MPTINTDTMQEASTVSLMMDMEELTGKGMFGSMARRQRITQLWNRAKNNDALAQKFVADNPTIFDVMKPKTPMMTPIEKAAVSLVNLEERIHELEATISDQRAFLLGMFSEEELDAAVNELRLNAVSRGTNYPKLRD
ncbi:hypothetical protein [Weissella confusa]|uniref:hypothetical protein n=1 Tax=Weissella confusa TaxID=1583 RepID=UPI0018F1FCAD|nr:hypothetical protein [Weissella confusa]MBJ7623315.1 hypothetical protein [Weissella confusa]MBJ7651676.1 hypothetical protein [Weissella confusa]MBJ7657279.1 hypothetical protein [Weissella confusa]MBJ7665303.1 hypothetical protein [Weissella confusa]MBJ7674865.1 hypothetical protein [Weissella confusa]